MSSQRSFAGLVLDPSQCSRLSLTEKRELVHEIAQWSLDAPTILSSFTRKELLEIICAEMGRDRKFAGRSKTHMIQRLLKLVSPKKISRKNSSYEKSFHEEGNEILQEESDKTHICGNVACQATLSSIDGFCERCSCFICHDYDDNKDPSRWITCDSESCGSTYHLVCVLKDERCGISETSEKKLDGSFTCVSCGTNNSTMSEWKKQILIASEARRVDVLCERVLFGYKILLGTENFLEIHNYVERALKKLQDELGSLDLISVKMAPGIVKRLLCGAEVQALCSLAVEAYDSLKLRNLNPFFSKQLSATCRNGTKRKKKSLEKGAFSSEVSSLNRSFYPTTPCKSDWMEKLCGLECKGASESAYEYSVRAVKGLESRGLIEEEFRVKFLTWFSLKATVQQRRVVNAFVDTLKDDPESLAGQIVHSFSDLIWWEQKPNRT